MKKIFQQKLENNLVKIQDKVIYQLLKINILMNNQKIKIIINKTIMTTNNITRQAFLILALK